MTLASGTKLGPYEIVAAIGAGGMGEVYRARDTKLGRDVAIKVLPASFSQDSDRLHRFEQEACAAGALNHPNILVIHHVDQHEGTPYIVSELLEGETLRQRMSAGPLPQRKTIDYAQQIARGLAAAHEKGIVHRDLKPENLFITNDGHLKILDFGLAKLTGSSNGDVSQTSIPTRRVNSNPGRVIGTVGYMSPEQVKARPVDHRSDIFSFGAILYEMLSGRRAFQGDSAAETMSAILREDPPDLSESNKIISPALERVVRHCLEKNPAERFQSARDLAFDLETIPGGSGSAAVPLSTVEPIARKRRIWMLVGFLSLAMIAGLSLLMVYVRRPTAELKAVRFAITMPEKISFAGLASVSPNGRLVALRVSNAAGHFSYFVRSLDSADARPLPGTEDGRFFFWSPDSRRLGFTAGEKLLKIDLSGGPPQVVCDMKGGKGGAWSPGGVILFSKPEGIFRVPDSGGTPILVRAPDTTHGEQELGFPSFLPDGRHFLYLAISTEPGANSAYIGSLDSQDTKRLMNTEMAAAYAAPGYLLFVRDGALLAQPFDPGRLELSGEPAELVRQVTTGTAYNYAPFSVSENGVLVYQARSPLETQLTWFDRSGRELARVGSPGVISEPVLSPDQKWVAFPRRDNQFKRDLWLLDLERGNASRLTTEGDNTDPVWSPDGRAIVFDKRSSGTSNLFEKSVSGTAKEQLIFEGTGMNFTDAWSPDNRFILFIHYDPKTQTEWDEWMLPTFGDRKPRPYIQTPFNDEGAAFAPDGRWVAYSSNESGKVESYVQSFPAAGSRIQISNSGGGEVRWRRDGRELFYIGLDQELRAVEIKVTGNTLTAGVPQRLFQTDVNPLRDMRNHYDVSADGQRFLFAVPTQKASAATVNVVVNWTADLKR